MGSMVRVRIENESSLDEIHISDEDAQEWTTLGPATLVGNPDLLVFNDILGKVCVFNKIYVRRMVLEEMPDEQD
jgi:hypothetical protein